MNDSSSFPKRVDLIRHRPDGTSSLVPDVTPAKARMFASMALSDNGDATKREAQEFASALPFGERVDHPAGRGFTIVAAGEGVIRELQARIERVEQHRDRLKAERDEIEQIVHTANYCDGEAWGDKSLIDMVRELASDAGLPVDEHVVRSS